MHEQFAHICCTLQRTATHCKTLQHIAAHRDTLQYTVALQHTATHRSTRHAHTCSYAVPTLPCRRTINAHCKTLQHTATQCNTHCKKRHAHNAPTHNLYHRTRRRSTHFAKHCKTLQCTSTHCNTLQHTVISLDTHIHTQCLHHRARRRLRSSNVREQGGGGGRGAICNFMDESLHT